MKHLIALAMLLLVGCANTVTAPIPDSSTVNASSTTLGSSSSNISVSSASVMNQPLVCIGSIDSIPSLGKIVTQPSKGLDHAMSLDFIAIEIDFTPENYGSRVVYVVDSVQVKVNSVLATDVKWTQTDPSDSLIHAPGFKLHITGTATGVDTSYMAITSADEKYYLKQSADVTVFLHAGVVKEITEQMTYDPTVPLSHFTLHKSSTTLIYYVVTN